MYSFTDGLPPQRKTLMETILHLYKTGLNSNVTIFVGPERYAFNVHEFILGARSEIFMTMMQQRWNETENQIKVLEFPANSVPAFKIFMHVR
jgi:hypothetical protein